MLISTANFLRYANGLADRTVKIREVRKCDRNCQSIGCLFSVQSMPEFLSMSFSCETESLTRYPIILNITFSREFLEILNFHNRQAVKILKISPRVLLLMFQLLFTVSFIITKY